MAECDYGDIILLMRYAIIMTILISSRVATAQVGTPSLAPPQPGNVLGTYAQQDFGPAAMARGAFSLPSPMQAPQDRGPLLVNLFPSYSPENGLSEWGSGWTNSLTITRAGILKGLRSNFCFCDADQLSSPFGRLVPTSSYTGTYYPMGLQTQAKFTLSGDTITATMADGSVWTWGGTYTSSGTRGVWAWYLSSIVTTTGRRTDFTYQSNSSGQWFLATVSYGGYGTNYQYEIDLSYNVFTSNTTTSFYRTSYISGMSVLLDRQVSSVTVKEKNATTGVFQERWQYALSYTGVADSGPIYLSSIQRQFASGTTEPAVTYDYAFFDSDYLASSYALVPTAVQDDETSDPTRFHTNETTWVDINGDGLIDIEQPIYNIDGGVDTFEDWIQNASGDFTPETHTTSTPDPICWPSGPRQIVGLDPVDSGTAQVVGFEPYYLHVCDLDGFALSARVEVPAVIASSQTQFVDMDGDQKPDLVVRDGESLAIYKSNSTISDTTDIAFTSVEITGVSLDNTNPIQFADMNGDGLPEILQPVGTPGSYTSMNVYTNLGVSDYEMSFSGPTSWSLPAWGSFSIQDVNGDGLADFVETGIGTGLLAINNGSSFVSLAGDFLGSGMTFISVADVIGSGNTEVLAIDSENNLWSRPIAKPGTGLMSSTNDGRGTNLAFTYKKSDALYPGTLQRFTVLSSLVVSQTGDDQQTFNYTYFGPEIDSQMGYLKQFESVTRTSRRAVTTATFTGADFYAAYLTSELTTDLSAYQAGGVTQSSYFSQQPSTYTFDGLSAVRTAIAGKGTAHKLSASDIEYTAKETTSVTTWSSDGRCALETQTTNAGDSTAVLDTLVTLASPSGLSSALHCLPQTKTVTGIHDDSSLNFVQEVQTNYNSAGQPVSVQSIGSDETITLQNIDYNSDFTIHDVSSPASGTTTFAYDSSTYLLTKHNQINM